MYASLALTALQNLKAQITLQTSIVWLSIPVMSWKLEEQNRYQCPQPAERPSRVWKSACSLAVSLDNSSLICLLPCVVTNFTIFSVCHNVEKGWEVLFCWMQIRTSIIYNAEYTGSAQEYSWFFFPKPPKPHNANFFTTFIFPMMLLNSTFWLEGGILKL